MATVNNYVMFPTTISLTLAAAKSEDFRLSFCAITFKINCIISDHSMDVTDGWTDGQTDNISVAI